MKYENFSIVAFPQIRDAACRYCGCSLHEVSDGWISSAMFCKKCEKVFQLKLVAVPDKKITPEFIEQCKKELEPKGQ